MVMEQSKPNGVVMRFLKEYSAISLLFVLNLLNYIDRYSLAGTLTNVRICNNV
jgi:hypothetical protein